MMNPKNGLHPGEYAWEVMQQSDTEGEIPMRIIVSTDYIRTATSLFLTIPEEVKEFWRVQSSEIIKLSWCPQLCVLSILYHSKGDEKEHVKVFLTNHLVANKIIRTYKKIKPVAVHLSPARPFVSRKTNGVSVSFKMADSLPNEKFWRVIHYVDEWTAKEMFFGLNAAGCRLIDPMTHQMKLVINSSNILLFGHFVLYGGTVIKVKFMDDLDLKNKAKRKKLLLEVHPVVGKDIMSHYEYCSTHGDEFKLITEIPKFQIPEGVEKAHEHPKLQKCLSESKLQEAPLKRSKRRSQHHASRLVSSPRPQSELQIDVSSENKENINPITNTKKQKEKQTEKHGTIQKNTEVLRNCDLQLKVETSKDQKTKRAKSNVTKL